MKVFELQPLGKTRFKLPDEEEDFTHVLIFVNGQYISRRNYSFENAAINFVQHRLDSQSEVIMVLFPTESRKRATKVGN
jgi:hypothetical protein